MVDSGANGVPFSFANLGGNSMIYFNDAGIPQATLPFNNMANRNAWNTYGFKDDTGSVVPMFSDEDDALKHLPADIALNAAPSGKYGSPIKNLHFIDILTHFPSPINALKFGLSSDNWLRRQYYPINGEMPAETPVNHLYSSAFDRDWETGSRYQ